MGLNLKSKAYTKHLYVSKTNTLIWQDTIVLVKLYENNWEK
jgi:hypothetical protein